jgi:hypothetical protein
MEWDIPIKQPSGRPTPPPSPNLGVVGATGGFNNGYEVREKDLPKLHKAVWNEDLGKVKSLVKKETKLIFPAVFYSLR